MNTILFFFLNSLILLFDNSILSQIILIFVSIVYLFIYITNRFSTSSCQPNHSSTTSPHVLFSFPPLLLSLFPFFPLPLLHSTFPPSSQSSQSQSSPLLLSSLQTVLSSPTPRPPTPCRGVCGGRGRVRCGGRAARLRGGRAHTSRRGRPPHHSHSAQDSCGLRTDGGDMTRRM